MAAHTEHGSGSGGGHGSHGAGPATDLDLLTRLGYEPRDIALNTLTKWLGGLMLFLVGALFLALAVYSVFVPKETESQAASPLAYVRQLPPNPQLQARPKRDMTDYWVHEDAIVKGYTPSDKPGTANLPIGQAIDLLAAKGISGVRESGQAPASTAAYPGSGIYDSPAPAVNVLDGVSGSYQGTPGLNPFVASPATLPYDNVSTAPAQTDAGGALSPKTAAAAEGE